MADKKKILSEKQKRFCKEYLIDFNGSAAAWRAGYSRQHGPNTASKYLKDPLIMEYINELRKPMERKLEISRERTMMEIARIAFSDLRKYFGEDGQLRPLHELDDDAAAALASVETEELFDGVGKDKVQIGQSRKIKTYDKTKALEMLAKHYKIYEDAPPVNVNIDLGKLSADDLKVLLALKKKAAR